MEVCTCVLFGQHSARACVHRAQFISNLNWLAQLESQKKDTMFSGNKGEKKSGRIPKSVTAADFRHGELAWGMGSWLQAWGFGHGGFGHRELGDCAVGEG